MSVRVACPFCNTSMSLDETPSNSRVICVRCGESFPLSRAEVAEEVNPRLQPSLNGDGHSQHPNRSAQSHWPLALLAITTAIVVIGLGMWAILRIPTKKNAEVTSQATSRKISTFPPSVVPGLRYLPSDSNIVFAVQMGPLREYAEREKTDIRTVLLKVGLTEKLIDGLVQKGIKLEELETLTGGLAIICDALLPRLMLVVQFQKEPEDRSGLLKNLKATQFTAPSGATRYKVDLGGLPTELQILDAKVYVFANNGSDLDSATKRDAGSGHLPNGLRDSMKQLSPASLAWLVTDSEEWSKKPIVKLAASLVKQEDLSGRLKDFRATAIGVSLEPALGISINLRGAEAEGGEKLRDRIAASLVGKGDKLQFGATGPWATIDVPLGADVSAISFRELFPAK